MALSKVREKSSVGSTSEANMSGFNQTQEFIGYYLSKVCVSPVACVMRQIEEGDESCSTGNEQVLQLALLDTLRDEGEDYRLTVGSKKLAESIITNDLINVDDEGPIRIDPIALSNASCVFVLSEILKLQDCFKYCDVFPRSIIVKAVSLFLRISTVVLMPADYVDTKKKLFKILDLGDFSEFSYLRAGESIRTLIRRKLSIEIDNVMSILTVLTQESLMKINLLGLQNDQGDLMKYINDTKRLLDEERHLTEEETTNSIIDDLKLLLEDLKPVYNKLKQINSFVSKNPSKDKRIYNKQMDDICKSFMMKKGLDKNISHTGSISSIGNLFGVISYVNLILKKADLNEFSITREDYRVLEVIKETLLEYSENKGSDSLSQVLSFIRSKLSYIESYISQDAWSEYNTSKRLLLNSRSYNEVWSYAVRLKGLIYEDFFSQEYKISRTPEEQKRSILDIVRSHIPDSDKEKDFIDATSKVPSLRDLKPDFYFVLSKPTLAPERSTVVETKRIESGLAMPIDAPDIVPVVYSSTGSGLAPHLFVDRIIDSYKSETQDIVVVTSEDLTLLDAVKEKKLNPKDISDSLRKVSSTENNCLIMVEVGYQTSSEDKVVLDADKLKTVTQILGKIGLKTCVICLSESTEKMRKASWIQSDTLKNMILTTFPPIFRRLIESSPIEITELSLMKIGSQKIRTLLSSNRAVRTPVTKQDVKEQYKRVREEIRNRPSGAYIPTEWMPNLDKTLSESSVISTTSANKIFESVKGYRKEIIKWVEESDLRFEYINGDSFRPFLEGCSNSLTEWKKESGCSKAKKTVIKQKRGVPKLSDPSAPHPSRVEEDIINGNFQILCCKCQSCQEQPRAKKSMGSKALFCIKNSFDKVKCKTDHTFLTSRKATCFDKLNSLILPGRTAAQKKQKSDLIKLSREISRYQKDIPVNSKYVLQISLKKLSQLESEDNPGVHSKHKSGKLIPLEHLISKVEGMSEKNYITKEAKTIMKEVSSELKSYLSMRESNNLEACLVFEESMYLNKIPVDKAIKFSSLLSPDKTEGDVVNRVLESRRDKSFYKRKTPLFSTTKKDLVEHFDDLQDFIKLDENNNKFKLDCIAPKSFLDTYLKEYKGTLCEESINMIVKTIDLVLNTKLGTICGVLSKLASVYLNCTSELQSKGIKIASIPHTGLYLAGKFFSRKQGTNNKVVILDREYNPISEWFYLNNAKAVMWQGMFSCLITLIVQEMQLQRCTQLYDFPKEKVVEETSEVMSVLYLAWKEHLINVLSGSACNSVKELRQFFEEASREYRSDPYKRGIYTLASTMFAQTFLMPSLLQNSRSMNKLLQMSRYPLVLSISDYGFPKGVGKKCEAFLRNKDNILLFIYLSTIESMSIMSKDVESLKKTMMKSENLPHYYSISLGGLKGFNERQMLHDIYLCHIYNKENTDYNEGSIAVLEEFGEKHIEYEEHLARCVDENNFRDFRLLTAAYNHKSERIKREESNFDMDRQLPKILEESIKERQSKLAELEEHDFDDISESISMTSTELSPEWAESESLMREAKSSRLKIAQDYVERQLFKEKRGKDWTPDSLASSQRNIYTLSTDKPYIRSISIPEVIKDIKRVIKMNKKYTFGSSEVIQCATELSKPIFSKTNILHALKMKRNHEVLSNISETTSSVSVPKLTFRLSEAIESLKLQESVKLSQLIGIYKDVHLLPERKRRLVMRELQTILELNTDDQRKQIDTVKADLESMRLKALKGYRGILETYGSTFVDLDDCIPMYTAIKSLLKDTKKRLSSETVKLSDRFNEVLKDAVLMKSTHFKERSREFDAIIKSTVETSDLLTDAVDKDMKEAFQEDLSLILARENLSLEEFYQDLDKCVCDFMKLRTKVMSLMEEKKAMPEMSFPKREAALLVLETDLQNRYYKTLQIVSAWKVCISARLSWFLTTNKGIRNLLSLTKASIDFSDEEEYKLKSSFMNLLMTVLNPSRFFQRYLEKSESSLDDLILLSNYTEALFTKIENPLFSTIASTPTNIGAKLDMMVQLNKAMANVIISGNYFDFALLINNVAISSLNSARKILDKQSQSNILPRSIRSKVIFELIKVAKRTGMQSVQDLGFLYILDHIHRFYAVLAPKDQIGGHRDLLVQEIITKIVTHVSEAFCKSIMAASFKRDGLTNPYLKEKILEMAQDNMKRSIQNHGSKAISKVGTIGEELNLQVSLLTDSEKQDQLIDQDQTVEMENEGFRQDLMLDFEAKLEENEVNILDSALNDSLIFDRTVCISGDCTKWGPIHCPAFFSAMLQQLLTEFPDWLYYEMLVMLKSVTKQIEIPMASIRKVLSSFLLKLGRDAVPLKKNSDFLKDTAELSSRRVFNEKQLEEELSKFVETEWELKLVKVFTKWYISKGLLYFRPYNHMGQGIHHGASSLLGAIVSCLIDQLIVFSIESDLPGATVRVNHAGSSDDFTKVINITGKFTKSKFQAIETKYHKAVIDAMNYMIGVMRSCQMMISEKSVAGPLLCEFYSEFCIGDRVSPSPAKFTYPTLISHSINSPLTLYQSIHVSSQQAMYMGVPLTTIICSSIFKQLTFIMNSELVFRNLGDILYNSIPHICRAYIPKYSSLCRKNGMLNEANLIINHSKSILGYINNSTTPKTEMERKLLKISDCAALLLKSDSTGDVSTFKEDSSYYNPRFGPPTKEFSIISNRIDKKGKIHRVSKREAKEILLEERLPIRIEQLDSHNRQLFFLDEEEWQFDKDLIYEFGFEGELDKSQLLMLKSATKHNWLKEQGLLEDQVVTDADLETYATESSERYSDIESSSSESMSDILSDDEMQLGAESSDFWDRQNTITQRESHYQVKSLSESNIAESLYGQSPILSDLPKQLQSSIISLLLFNELALSSKIGSVSSMKAQKKFENSLMSDPFLLLLPEKVRHQISVVNEYRKDIEESMIIKSSREGIYTTSKDLITSLEATESAIELAKEDRKNPYKGDIPVGLIASNNLTEDFNNEQVRFKQALSSKPIVWALSGGQKRMSAPLNRQMLRAYLFNNRPKLQDMNHWMSSSGDKYISGSGDQVKGLERVKFQDFVEKLLKLKVFKFENDENLDSRWKKVALGDTKSVSICCVLGLLKDSQGVPLVDIDTTKEDKRHINTQEDLGFGNQCIVINIKGMERQLNFLQDTLNESDKSTINTIESAESSSPNNRSSAGYITINKSVLWYKEGLKQFVNTSSVVLGSFLDAGSIIRAKPLNLKPEYLSQDRTTLMYALPSLIKIATEMIDDYKRGNLEESSVINSLTNLLRLHGSSPNLRDKMYCFRSYSDKWISNASELVSLNTVEGIKYNLNLQEHRPPIAEKTFVLRDLITYISWLDLSNSDKTELLSSCLKCNIRDMIEEKRFNMYCNPKNLEAFRGTFRAFRSGSFAQIVSAEIEDLKRNRQKRKFKVLCDMVISPKKFRDEYSNLIHRTMFNSPRQMEEGSGFSLSSQFGTATGVITPYGIAIVLSKPHHLLMEEVEANIMKWSNPGIRYEPDITSRMRFLRSLIGKKGSKYLETSGRMYAVSITRENTFKIELMSDLQAMMNHRKLKKGYLAEKDPLVNHRVVAVSSKQLIETYSEVQESEIIPRIEWLSDKIEMSVYVAVDNMKESSYLGDTLLLTEAIKGKEVSDRLRNSIVSRERKEYIDSISYANILTVENIRGFHLLCRHILRDRFVNHEDHKRISLPNVSVISAMGPKSELEVVEQLNRSLPELGALGAISKMLRALEIDPSRLKLKETNSAGRPSWIISGILSDKKRLNILDKIKGITEGAITKECIKLIDVCDSNGGEQESISILIETIRYWELDTKLVVMLFSLLFISMKDNIGVDRSDSKVLSKAISGLSGGEIKTNVDDYTVLCRTEMIDGDLVFTTTIEKNILNPLTSSEGLTYTEATKNLSASIIAESSKIRSQFPKVMNLVTVRDIKKSKVLLSTSQNLDKIILKVTTKEYDSALAECLAFDLCTLMNQDKKYNLFNMLVYLWVRITGHSQYVSGYDVDRIEQYNIGAANLEELTHRSLIKNERKEETRKSKPPLSDIEYIKRDLARKINTGEINLLDIDLVSTSTLDLFGPATEDNRLIEGEGELKTEAQVSKTREEDPEYGVNFAERMYQLLGDDDEDQFD